MSEKVPTSYYDFEDNPVVAAVYDARVYTEKFSNQVNDIQVGDLKDQRKKIQKVFNPPFKIKNK